MSTFETAVAITPSSLPWLRRSPPMTSAELGRRKEITQPLLGIRSIHHFVTNHLDRVLEGFCQFTHRG